MGAKYSKKGKSTVEAIYSQLQVEPDGIVAPWEMWDVAQRQLLYECTAEQISRVQGLQLLLYRFRGHGISRDACATHFFKEWNGEEIDWFVQDVIQYHAVCLDSGAASASGGGIPSPSPSPKSTTSTTSTTSTASASSSSSSSSSSSLSSAKATTLPSPSPYPFNASSTLSVPAPSPSSSLTLSSSPQAKQLAQVLEDDAGMKDTFRQVFAILDTQRVGRISGSIIREWLESELVDVTRVDTKRAVLLSRLQNHVSFSKPAFRHLFHKWQLDEMIVVTKALVHKHHRLYREYQHSFHIAQSMASRAPSSQSTSPPLSAAPSPSPGISNEQFTKVTENERRQLEKERAAHKKQEESGRRAALSDADQRERRRRLLLDKERRAAEERTRWREKDRIRESKVTSSEKDAYCLALKQLFMQMEHKITTTEQDNIARLQETYHISRPEHIQMLKRMGITGERLTASQNAYTMSEGCLCVQCMATSAEVMLSPCLHICMCRECAHVISSQAPHRRQCPVCVQPIVGVKPIS